MVGIISAMVLEVNNCVFISLVLASSKRFSSYFSLPNARITESPVKISLDTRFSPSTNFCIIWNFGMATIINTIIIINTASTASTIIQTMEVVVFITLKIAPIPIIGANNTIRNTMVKTIWICCTSFVQRVISDEVENWFISALENPTTLWNSLPLTSLAVYAASLEESKPTNMLTSIISTANPSILNPMLFK